MAINKKVIHIVSEAIINYQDILLNIHIFQESTIPIKELSRLEIYLIRGRSLFVI
jgi:hypothetical protein